MTVDISRAECEDKKKKSKDKDIRILKFRRIHEKKLNENQYLMTADFHRLKHSTITYGKLDFFGKTRLDINFKIQSNYRSLKNK